MKLHRLVIQFVCRAGLSILIFLQQFTPILQSLPGNYGIDSYDIPTTYAGLIVDNIQGHATISFANQQGITSSTGVRFAGGLVQLLSGSLMGEIVMNDIQPISLSGWTTMTLSGALPSNTSITTTLLDCSTASPISGFENRNLPLSLSNLDKNTYPCIRVKYNLSRINASFPSPYISTARVSFDSISVLQTSIALQPSVQACNTVTYNVNVANNYIDNPGPIIIYIPKPSGSLISGYTISYNQYPGYEPAFASASDGGSYTVSALPNGVPADSIYRSLSGLRAGDTRQLNMSLTVPCGVQSGSFYSLTSYADSLYSESVTGNTIVTKVNSNPSPGHTITPINTLWMQDTHRVYASGLTTISYIDQISNYINATENIFNPTLSVNFSDIISRLQSRCGVVSTGAAMSRIGGLVGGTWSGNNYIRDQTFLGAGAGDWVARGGTVPVTYSINYDGCSNNVDTFTVTSTFDGDNINPITLIQPVRILTHLESSGGFTKRGPLTIYQGDSYQYSLSLTNRGTLAYSGYHIEDALPSGLQLLGISLNNGGFSGLSYTLGTGASGNLIIDVYGCINPPYLTPTSGPCLGAPTSVSINLQVKDIQPLSCSDYSINNTADFGWKEVATDPSATVFVDTNVTGSFVSDTRNVTARTNAPSLSIQSSGPTSLSVGDIGSYSYTISNNGRANSTATTMTISLPEVMINGVTGYISINTVVGATANYTNQQSGLVTLSLGTIAPGEVKTVTFKTMAVPFGITNNTLTSVNTRVVGNTAACGTISATRNSPLTLVGQNQMRITKYRNFSLITQTGYIEYQLPITNNGQVAVTNAYAVDIIPSRTQFIEAYTNYETPYYTYNCRDCRVYFAGQDPNLPAIISVSTHFTRSMIETYFLPGTEVSTGIWHSPFGTGTKYVAFAVDNSNGVYPVNVTKTPGFKLQDVSTPVGSLIVNRAEILADGLLPAITVPVQTTVFGTPGLRINLASDVEVVAACDPFVWTLDYSHDGSATNTKTIISTFFPTTSVLSTGAGSIIHRFNALASIQGAISGSYDIHNSPSLQLTPVGSGMLVRFDVSEYLSGYLDPGWGGSLQFKMNANCANPTNTIMQADAEGEYENEISEGIVYAEDPVLVANADLWIQKEADQPKPLPGEVVNYTLTLSNEGPHFASGVELSDLLPVGMCYVSGSTYISTPGWSLGQPIISGSCAGGQQQQLIWTMGDSNTIDGIAYPMGYLPGDSEPLFINYQTEVIATVPAGTALINGAHTTTITTEDPYFPNDSSKQVETPFPDPTIMVSQPVTTSQGDTFDLTLKYKNNHRMCANSGYVVATLPNYALGGYADVQVASVAANPDQTIYYHSCPYTSVPPSFDHSYPLSNGWTTAQGSSVCYIAIRHNDLLCDTDGRQQTIVSLVATKPDGSTLPPGTTLTSSAFVYGLDDEDLTNNTGSATTTIPSLDLYATITGTAEGGYPGTVPGAVQNYHIQFGLQGTQTSCDNFIDVVISSGIVLNDSIWNDFTTLQLFDQAGAAVFAVDQYNVPITSPISITPSLSTTSTGATLIRFILGNPSSAVCIPAGALGSFTIFASIDPAILDSSSLEAIVTIGENSPGIEDTLMNNTDSTQVTAYRADLMIQKSALSDTNADGIYDLLDSPTMTDRGQTIRYTLEYDNIGNAPASGVVMNERIPAQTCYRIGSLESNQPDDTVLEYSNDGGISYTYLPTGTTGAQDCLVTDWRLRWLSDMPAPAHVAGDDPRRALMMTNLSPGIISGSLGYPLSLTPSLTYLSGIINNPDTSSYNGFNNALLAVDINNDGYQDIVAGGAGSPYANIYINRGSREFSDTTVVLGSGGFFDMLAVDVNNDGYQDIVATYYANTGYLFFNNGDETFVQIPLTGTDATRVARILSVDVDSDGDRDIFLGGTNGYRDAILLNDGLGGFTTTLLDSTYTVNIGTGDMNNDGNLDIVVGGATFTKIYYGDGTGGLVSTSLGGYGYGLQVFDANTDGYPDIVTVGYPGYSAGTGRVYLNDGTGGFATTLLPGPHISSNGYNSTDIGDVDGDGDIDMVQAGYGSGSKLYLNDGSGVFSYVFLTGGVTDFISMKLSDIDLDGDLDIVGYRTYPATAELSIYRNDGTGVFSPRENTPSSYPSGYPHGSQLVDFDNDGYPDTIASSFHAQGILSINWNESGSFKLPSYFVYQSSDYLTGYDVAHISFDADLDGDLDIIGGSFVYSQGTRLYSNEGSGVLKSYLISLVGAQALWHADLNNDGYDDIVTLAPDSQTNIVLLNNGIGGFTTSATISNGRLIDIEFADFDLDGDLDIIGIKRTGTYSRALVVRLNDGSGNFPTESLTMSIGNNRNNIEMADLNADGYKDIVYGGSSDGGGGPSDYGIVFNQSGTGLLAGPTSSPLYITQNGIKIHDMDHDGDQDIVLGGPYTRVLVNDGLGVFSTITVSGYNGLDLYDFNTIVADLNADGYKDIVLGYDIYTNTTTGNFVRSVLTGATTGAAYTSTDIGDIDHDGDLDLIIAAGIGSGQLSVYLNNGLGGFSLDFHQPIQHYPVLGVMADTTGLVDLDHQGYLDYIGPSNRDFRTYMVYRFQSSYASAAGSYLTILSATGTMTSRNRLLLNQSLIPGQNTISYTIYPTLGSGGCDTGTILAGPTEIPAGSLDISAIDPSMTSICVQADFQLLTGTVSPVLSYMGASYYSPDRPSVSFDVQVTTGTLSTQTIPNTAYISTITPETDLTNNSSDYEMTIRGTDLSIIKSVDLGAVHAGDIVTYTLDYKNEGPQDASGVVITDILPESLTYLSSNPVMTNLGGGGGVISHTGFYTTGDICYQQYMIGTGVYRQALNARFITLVSQPLNSRLASTGRPPNGTGFNQACTSLRGQNNLGACASILSVNLDTYNSQCGILLSSEATYGYTIPYLAVGSGGSITITARVNSGVQVGDILTNYARIDSDTAELNYDNNESRATSIVGDIANIYTIIDTPSTFTLNSLFPFTVRYGNNGNMSADDTLLRVDLPADTTYDSQTAGPSCTYILAGNYIECAIGTLAPGVRTQLDFIARISNNVALLTGGTPLVFTSTITTSTTELNLIDNVSADQAIPVLGDASHLHGMVYLDVQADNSYTTGDVYLPGEEVLLAGTDIFGVLYGPDPSIYPTAYQTMIVDRGLTGAYVIVPPSVTDHGGNYYFLGLNPGSYAVHHLVSAGDTPVSSTGGYLSSGTKLGQGSLDNASIDPSDIIDITLGEAEYTRYNTFGVTIPTVLNVATTIDATMQPGQQVSLSIGYANTTTQIATNTILTVTLDPAVEYISDTLGGVYNPTERTVTFSLGNLTPATTLSLAIQTQLQSGYIVGTGQDLIFDTNISTQGTELTYSDNADRDIIPLVLVPAIQLIKTTSTPILLSGATGDYMIFVSNIGDTPLYSVQVTDTIAPGCSRTIGSLGVGASTGYSCSLANITSTTTNIANVIGMTTGGVSVTDTGSATITVTSTPPVVLTPSIDIVKTTSTPSIASGATGQYTITVVNNGQLLLTGVQVTDTIAPGCSRTIGSLGVGASTGYSCSLGNIMNTTINTAIAIGTTTGGVSVSDTGSATITVTSIPPISGCTSNCGGGSSSSPSIDILKITSTPVLQPGATAQYTIRVINTGPHSLTGVQVTDTIAPGCSRTIGSLGVGASTGYSCNLPNITKTTINTAIVQGLSLTNGVTVSDQDDAIVTIQITPTTGIHNAPSLQPPIKITPTPEYPIPKTGPEDKGMNQMIQRSDIAYPQARSQRYVDMMRSKHVFHRTKHRLGYTPKISAGYLVIPKYGVVIPLKHQNGSLSYDLTKLSYQKLQLALTHIQDSDEIWLYDRDSQTKSFVMNEYISTAKGANMVELSSLLLLNYDEYTTIISR